MKTKQILRIVVASPGDVQPERDLLAERVIPELNNGIADAYNVSIELARWETDAYPGFHLDGPQGLIDAVLKIDQCDVLIGIFWKRFGTPTKDGTTGTEHEFLTAYQAWQLQGTPEIMVYFKTKGFDVMPNDRRDLEQAGKVIDFKKNFPKEGMYQSFTNEQEFESLARKHLTSMIRKIAAPLTNEPQRLTTTSQTSDRPVQENAHNDVLSYSIPPQSVVSDSRKDFYLSQLQQKHQDLAAVKKDLAIPQSQENEDRLKTRAEQLLDEIEDLEKKLKG
jgi:Domain of unknown function (DUF4062)